MCLLVGVFSVYSNLVFLSQIFVGGHSFNIASNTVRYSYSERFRCSNSYILLVYSFPGVKKDISAFVSGGSSPVEKKDSKAGADDDDLDLFGSDDEVILFHSNVQ